MRTSAERGGVGGDDGMDGLSVEFDEQDDRGVLMEFDPRDGKSVCSRRLLKREILLDAFDQHEERKRKREFEIDRR